MALVFLPLAPEELAGWATAGALDGPRRGFAVTPAMTAAFGLDDPEDAEYTALCVASVAGLLAHGSRLVAVAELPVRAIGDDFGTVEVAAPPWAAVSALFGDEAAAEHTKSLAGDLAGASLDAAWDHARVQQLLSEADLLWHGPGEWQLLAGG